MKSESLERDKWVCTECYATSQRERLLTAPSPFEADCEVWGCPECKSINRLALACDWPGCKDEVSCGTPTESGYRNTCSKHKPLPASGWTYREVLK